MTEYQFTNNWFGGNIPTWDYLMNQFKPATILEIGSFEGRSTCYIIEKCSSHHAIDVTCIDSWEGGVEEHQKGTAMSEIERRFDHNVALAQSRAKNPVTLNKIKMHSVPACCRLMATRGEQAFDLIYVDGSHQAPDVLADAVLAFNLLRVGGLMIFDDYLWCMEAQGKEDPLNMPKPAIDAFMTLYARKMKIISGAPIYQIYAQKTGR